MNVQNKFLHHEKAVLWKMTCLPLGEKHFLEQFNAFVGVVGYNCFRVASI